MEISKKDFTSLINNNKKIFYKVCNFYCDDEDEKKDLFQDIVLELWKSFNSFKGNSKLSTWVYRVSLNTALNFNRRKKRMYNTFLFTDKPLSTVDFYFNHEVETLETKQLFEICLTYLSEFDRAIFLLYLDEFPHEEIAELVGTSVTNIGTRISRIKKNLKKHLKSLNEVDNGRKWIKKLVEQLQSKIR